MRREKKTVHPSCVKKDVCLGLDLVVLGTGAEEQESNLGLELLEGDVKASINGVVKDNAATLASENNATSAGNRQKQAWE